MIKVRNARFTCSRKRITASATVLLWLVSTWAAAAYWCCELAGRNEFPGKAAHAEHEPGGHGVHQDGHDHAAKVADESPQQPPNPDCAEIAPTDKGLRLAEGTLALPGANEIANAVAPPPWPIEIPKLEAHRRWVLPPPSFQQPSPFLSTIRLLL